MIKVDKPERCIINYGQRIQAASQETAESRAKTISIISIQVLVIQDKNTEFQQQANFAKRFLGVSLILCTRKSTSLVKVVHKRFKTPCTLQKDSCNTYIHLDRENMHTQTHI